MLKSIVAESQWAESAPAFSINGKQFYFVRVNPKTENGFVTSIEDVIDHVPTAADKEALYANWLQLLKAGISNVIADYAKSNAVKTFKVNGTNVAWLDSEARVSIRQSIEDKAAAGRSTITIFLSDGGHELSIEQARAMFVSLEVYASDCYEVTEDHQNAILPLTTIEEVEAYDYTGSYPEVPSFTL